jgi:hypothetical protein
VFELPSYIWADRVYVTGSFNDWDKNGVPVCQDRDGVWRAAVDLPVGQRHEFRYVVDGEWHTDYHADGFTDNIYGSHNSVVDLEHVPVAPIAPRLSSNVTQKGHSAAVQLPSAAVGKKPAELPPVEMPRRRPRVAAA